jgi:hypothetical protein
LGLLALTLFRLEQPFVVLDRALDVRPDVVNQNVAVFAEKLATLLQRAPTLEE